MWSLERQGEEIKELWRGAWESYKVGRPAKRIENWKIAVEARTDTVVTPQMYSDRRKNRGGETHVHQMACELERKEIDEKIVEEFGCQEAAESVKRRDVTRIWCDASVCEKGAAAAVLIDEDQESLSSLGNAMATGERTTSSKKTKDVRNKTPNLYWFPVRGNSFRAEALGLWGAKRISLQRSNFAMKK